MQDPHHDQRPPDPGDEEPAARDPRDPSSSDQEALIAGLLERESVYGLLQRGRALMQRRHFAQAAVILQRAVHLEPGKGSLLEPLGRSYYNSGQHERAAAVFEELLTVDPTLAYAHYGLGQSLKRLGRTGEARTHLRLAVALQPGSLLYQRALQRLG